MVSLECMDQEHLPPQQDGSLAAAVAVAKEQEIVKQMVVVVLLVVLDSLAAEMVVEVLEEQDQMFQSIKGVDMLELVVAVVDIIRVHMDQEAVVQVLW
jgi:hypothetical protein